MPGMTPDIEKLREAMPTLEPIIDRLELQLVDDPTWNEPSDTSYLSDSDRQNPDIAANVEAMAETNKLIAWFGRDAEGYLGLWRGPQNRSLTEAPVVRLDTEGQYSIVAATVPEYLAIAMPEDEFADTRDALTKAGFKVGFNPDAIWGALDAFDDDPNAYRNELYERARQARGLDRSDDEGDAGEGAEGVEADGAVEAEDNAVPEPTDFASGSMPQLSTAPDDDEDLDDADDGDTGDVGDADGAGDEDDDGGGDLDEDEEPPPLAAAPTTRAPTVAEKPAAKAAAKKAAQPAAKKPPAKAAAKKSAAKKPAAKAAAKKPAKKAAAKPTAKKAAKPAAKKPAAKAAAKKPAAKPAKKKKK
jgi:hypothetical protein